MYRVLLVDDHEVVRKGIRAILEDRCSPIDIAEAGTGEGALQKLEEVFDAVILSQTIQATEKPRVVMEHLLRIGRRVAISLPNFGYWKVRLSLLAGGRMPRTQALGYAWWETPNIHLCTLADFVDLTRECGATIVEAHALNDSGRTQRIDPARLTGSYMGANLFAQGAIFLLKKS